ncbi:MAG: TerB family tellurite resistance protein, partial [Candidatus Adiutrix sp.]|nr:TerB family tellurite resistance protein [Candidatus Adiutrix sp.]
ETRALYEILGEAPPAQIGRKEAENLAVVIENLGFGLVPDVRYHGAKPDGNGQVAVFPRGPGRDFNPSGEFRQVGAILLLGALVSQSDGQVSPHEENLLQGLVQDNRELTGPEKASLLAYLHWRLYAPQGTIELRRKLSELDPARQEFVGRLLISIAHADGRIEPEEVRRLEKLYAALGLDKARVAGDLHAQAGAGGAAGPGLEPNLTRPPGAEPAFSLNDELIRLKERETRQVRDVLEGIFAEPPEPPAPAEPRADHPENPLAGLDQPHQRLLRRLMGRERWERPEVHEICGELSLMLDGALEVLNEWAFANTNAPLIEDGDPIYVDIELAKEMTHD